MDLQVYAIILIVFLVSFLSYLFISKFLPNGKSFDEMIAEKKRMREEVLGTVKAPSKQSNVGNKKKPKKEVKKKDTKITKESAKDTTSQESDASESSEAVRSEPPSPPEQVILRKNAAKPQQVQQQAGKKGKAKSGILMNKNDPILVKEVPAEIEVNHFAEIHPKDAVEIHRNAIKDEPAEKNTKNFRDGKKLKPAKTETPPISPKNQPAKEVKPVEEKPARKKRSEPSTSGADNTSIMVSDETGIKPLIRELSQADLTKNQIQVLIDFLLNKQSDTFTKDPTEWSEGKSDLMQKLKKQLQEKEAQLKNEQDALIGMQSKLKELRGEINAEKSLFNATLKGHQEQLNNSRGEIKTLQAEILFLNDKHNSEKQSMSSSFKQLQAQYVQVKESLTAQEGLASIQQLTGDNQMLQQELHKINQQNESFKQMLAERDNKITDFEVHLRKNDERCLIIENELTQRVQDLANRDTELQKLNAEVQRAKELDKLIQRQTYEVDQLKQQLCDQEQNNHAEENNKIEIRNLQNALDSSKKELDAQRGLVNDYKMKVDDLSKQLNETAKQLTNSKSGGGDSFLLNEKMNEMMASHQHVISEKDKQLADYQKQLDTLQKAEAELTKQIDEQKSKNNDLRMKNWKLVEALQSAEKPTSKSTNHSNLVAHDGIDVKKFKDLIVEYFPDATSSSTNDGDDTKWLACVLENLKAQLVSNNHISKNNNHLNNCSSDVETNKLNNSNAMNGDSTSSTSSTSADNELILLQNAQLKTTVEDYKTIIAETESMLKNLESKVREQDAYWTKVVHMKDNEIENLKTQGDKTL